VVPLHAVDCELRYLIVGVRVASGARHALTNAIRHAWLICHDGCESINYRRKTTSDQEHYGPLHDFIESLNTLVQCTANIDGLHREVRALNLQMHSNITVP
jgi:hypothetical protein